MTIPTTNLTLWLKADTGVYSDAGITPVTSGQAVHQWNDQSGLGNHAVQATSGNQPIYNTSQINSLPALTFNGTSDYLSHADTTEVGSVFVVYIMTKNVITASAVAPVYCDLMGADTTPATGGCGSYYFEPWGSFANTNNSANFIRCTGADTNFSTPLSWAARSSPVIGYWDVLAGRNTGSALSIYKRGVQMGGTVSIGSNTARAIINPIIGAAYYSAAPTNFFGGQIAEVIKYSSNLSDSDFSTISAYLNAKYGFNIAPEQYIFIGFQGVNINCNVITLTSSDAVTWNNVLPSHYLPPSGQSVRDPSTFYDAATSKWWMAHTAAGVAPGFHNPCNSFAIASSSDPGPPGYPINWTYVTGVDCSAVVGTGGTETVYAPEWFEDVDGSIHITFSGSSSGGTNGNGNQPYEVHPTNAGMTAWSTPVLITGAGLSAINAIDYQFNIIDGVYTVFCKDQTNSTIDEYTSSSPFSGYVVSKSGNWAGWATPGSVNGALNGVPSWEGPELVVMSAGNYHMTLDAQGAGMYYSTSSNLLTWSAPAPMGNPFVAPYELQHGHILNLQAALTGVGGRVNAANVNTYYDFKLQRWM